MNKLKQCGFLLCLVGLFLTICGMFENYAPIFAVGALLFLGASIMTLIAICNMSINDSNDDGHDEK